MSTVADRLYPRGGALGRMGEGKAKQSLESAMKTLIRRVTDRITGERGNVIHDQHMTSVTRYHPKRKQLQ